MGCKHRPGNILLWETIRADYEWKGEFKNQRKNGETFWESATITPIYTHREMSHFLAVKQDITEIKNTENHLRLLTTAFDSAADRIYIFSLVNGNVLYSNIAIQRFWGTKIRTIKDFRALFQENLQALSEVIQAATVESLRGKLTGKTKNEKSIVLDTTISPVLGEQSSQICLIAIFRPT